MAAGSSGQPSGMPSFIATPCLWVPVCGSVQVDTVNLSGQVDVVNPSDEPAPMTSTRDALIDAAADLLTTGGPAAVTLREVGRRAGVSHNAPYKHFADKEELLAAVAARDLDRRAAATRRAARYRPPAEALRAILHGYARHAARDPELFRLTYGSWHDGSADLGAAAT